MTGTLSQPENNRGHRHQGLAVWQQITYQPYAGCWMHGTRQSLPPIAELPTQAYAQRDDADGREEHGDPHRRPRPWFCNQNGEGGNRQSANSHN